MILHVYEVYLLMYFMMPTLNHLINKLNENVPLLDIYSR